MIVSREDILKLKSEICGRYGNAQYLSISGKHDFDDVRGTKLWNLWYGDKELSISTFGTEYIKCLCGQYTVSQFYKRLRRLKRCLAYEFAKIRIKNLFWRRLNYD